MQWQESVIIYSRKKICTDRCRLVCVYSFLRMSASGACSLKYGSVPSRWNKKTNEVIVPTTPGDERTKLLETRDLLNLLWSAMDNFLVK